MKNHFFETIRDNVDSAGNQKVRSIAGKVHSTEFRHLARTTPKMAASRLGYPADFSGEVAVLENSEDKMYLVIPHVSNKALTNQDLVNIQAGGIALTVATGGTVGTATLTVSTASTVGTLGSVF